VEEQKKPFDARTATEAERKEWLANVNRRTPAKADEGFDARKATPEEVKAQAQKLGIRIFKSI